MIELPQLREHIETDLSDGALNRLLAEAVAYVEEYAGPLTATPYHVYPAGEFLSLPFPVASAGDVDSIDEIDGTVTTALDANDWRLINSRTLARLTNGTNARDGWGREAIVTYTPAARTAERDGAAIALVRLAVQHNALAGETAGDYSSKSVDYQDERRKVVRSLIRMLVA